MVKNLANLGTGLNGEGFHDVVAGKLEIANSEGLALNFEEAFFEFFGTPGCFGCASAETVGTAKLKHVFNVFEADVFKKAANGRVSLAFVDSELVETDESVELFFLFFGEAETMGNTVGDFGTNNFVIIESDDIIGLFFKGGGFTNIMDEGGKKGDGVLRCAIFERDKGVGADVIEVMALGRALINTEHFFGFGENLCEKGSFTEELDSFGRVGGKEDFEKFITDAFAGNAINEWSVDGDGVDSMLFNSEA